MSGNAMTLPLLEFMQHKAGCLYLSDLQNIADWQRSRLARELKQIPAEDTGLREWNDALAYLTGAPPEKTAQAARERLIHALEETVGKE